RWLPHVPVIIPVLPARRIIPIAPGRAVRVGVPGWAIIGARGGAILAGLIRIHGGTIPVWAVATDIGRATAHDPADQQCREQQILESGCHSVFLSRKHSCSLPDTNSVPLSGAPERARE